MTIDEWCNCSICARRRQLKKIRNEWSETLIRPESTPEEGQSSDPLTEEDHEAAAIVLFNQLFGLLSLKAAPGRADAQAALQHALDLRRALKDALDRDCEAHGWLPYNEGDLFVLTNADPKKCLVKLVPNAREHVRVLEEARPSATAVALAGDFLLAAEQVDALIKGRALVNREPPEKRLSLTLWSLLLDLHSLERCGADREMLLVGAASVRIHERAGVLQDRLRRMFDSWEPVNVTPPPADPPVPEKPPSPFEPSPIVLTRPPRGLAPGLVEMVVRSADDIRTIVEEEVSSAEVLEAARQLAESVKELEELVHSQPAPEV
jgi:hypothetical protein